MTLNNEPSPTRHLPTDFRQSTVRSFFAHVLYMPRWQKSLLTMAIALLGVGAVGSVSGYISSDQSPKVQKQNLVSEDSTSPAPAPPKPTLRQRASPWMMRVGLSFIVGFVVGWVSRTFLKMVALIAGVGIAVMTALYYFHVLNIDFSAAEKQYASGLAWAADQAQRLGQAILHHLPGSTSGAMGTFVGFRRK